MADRHTSPERGTIFWAMSSRGSSTADPVLLPALYWQRRMYRAHSDRAYTENVAVEIVISGDWHLAVAELALRRLVARHESLRVVLVASSNGLVQEVVPLDRFMSRFTIITRHPKASMCSVAGEVGTLSRHPFKLTESPLLRAAIIVTRDGDAVVLVVANHAVTDGWSAAVLVRDFIQLYREASGSGRAQLPDVTGMYSEYARRYEASDEHAATVAHWRRTLASEVPPLRLPVSGPTHGWHLEPVGPLPSWAELAQVAGEEGMSPARLLQTLTVASLLPFAQATIEVGLVDANRAADGLRDAVGCMVEILPVRVAVSDHCSLRDLAAGLSASLRQARACRVPFSAVTAQLSAAVDPPRSLPDYRVSINVLPPAVADPDSAVSGSVTFRPKPAALIMEGIEGDDPGMDVELDYLFWPSQDRPTRALLGGSASDDNVQTLRRLGRALVRLAPRALTGRGRPVRPIAAACWEEALAAYPG
jgi:Condensation domain